MVATRRSDRPADICRGESSLRTCVLVLLTICLSAPLGATADNIPRPISPDLIKEDLYGAHFTGPENGWVVGTSGSVLE